MTSSNGIPASESQYTDVTFEELIDLETEQDAVDTEILRQHWRLSLPLFARRRAIIARIPHFWSLVFEEAPPEIEHHITPSDARLFAEHLTSFAVERFELDTEPRSVELVFGFSPNSYFEDAELRKKFWWRVSADGWSGLVSEPVRIRWKSGKDLTKGLTDATLALWDAWKLAGGDEKRRGFKAVQEHKAYETLKTKVEESDSVDSFFTLFAFVSTHRYISATESAEASEKEAQKRASKTNGTEEQDAEADGEVEEMDEMEVMACPQGDDIANVLVEELYTNAIKYFTSAHERDSEAQSEDDFEQDDEMDEDNILDHEVKKEPPKKKQKQK